MYIQRFAYLIFMLLALAVFFALRRWQPSSLCGQLSNQDRWALTLAAFIGGALGAKLPFVFAPAWGWLSGTVWIGDGKTITTAMAGAYLAVEIVKLARGIRAKTGDAFALPLAGALSVGRWGCFFNACCYGIPTTLPWGVDFLGDGMRHPTQVYESLFHLTMACVLLWLIVGDHLRYQKLKLYLICYCVYRFFTEWIRPEPAFVGSLTFYQWFALIFAAALAMQWWYDRKMHTRTLPVAIA